MNNERAATLILWKSHVFNKHLSQSKSKVRNPVLYKSREIEVNPSKCMKQWTDLWMLTYVFKTVGVFFHGCELNKIFLNIYFLYLCNIWSVAETAALVRGETVVCYLPRPVLCSSAGDPSHPSWLHTLLTVSAGINHSSLIWKHKKLTEL